jgi:hypothetical protein
MRVDYLIMISALVFFHGLFIFTLTVYQRVKTMSRWEILVSLFLCFNGVFYNSTGMNVNRVKEKAVVLLLLEVLFIALIVVFVNLLCFLIDEGVNYKQRRRFTVIEEMKEAYGIILDGSYLAHRALVIVYERHGLAFGHVFYIQEEANLIAVEIDEQARKLAYPELNDSQ